VRLRFLRTNLGIGCEAAASAGPGHRILRMEIWRPGSGWVYAFGCSCGWRGEALGKRNAPATRHSEDVSVAAREESGGSPKDEKL